MRFFHDIPQSLFSLFKIIGTDPRTGKPEKIFYVVYRKDGKPPALFTCHAIEYFPFPGRYEWKDPCGGREWISPS